MNEAVISDFCDFIYRFPRLSTESCLAISKKKKKKKICCFHLSPSFLLFASVILAPVPLSGYLFCVIEGC